MKEFRSKCGLIELVNKEKLELAELDFGSFVAGLPIGFNKTVEAVA